MPSTLITEIDRWADSFLGIRLRQSQINAGENLLGRTIVELPTGEGKTLATVLPATQFARQGRRVWIATANDYLASRDAKWMNPIYQAAGIEVTSITSATPNEDRAKAYQSNIVYGTMREFAFDHLRAAMASRAAGRHGASIQFDGDVLIIDEADSSLIDEARTPMVISMPVGAIDGSIEASFRWAAEIASAASVDVDYVTFPDSGEIALTQKGRQWILRRPMAPAMRSLSTTEILHAVERAIAANLTFRRDVQYIVDNDRIALIDEYTGRRSQNRTLASGLHQAIEAREGLALTPISQPVARITTAAFVAKFAHVCGLTATAWEDRHELESAYGLRVQVVAPERHSRRELLEQRYFASASEKHHCIADETASIVQQGRSVLIGARTIYHSSLLSEVFRKRGIQHELLTALNLEAEAGIVAKAGTPGRVTIATNLAGRGTDIRLDDEVARAGGLHVIVSEPHASARIDRQLIGRGARGGDPGSARIYASADDDIFRLAFGATRAAQISQRAMRANKDSWLWQQTIRATVARAQRHVCCAQQAERARLAVDEGTLHGVLGGLTLDPHLDPLPVR